MIFNSILKLGKQEGNILINNKHELVLDFCDLPKTHCFLYKNERIFIKLSEKSFFFILPFFFSVKVEKRENEKEMLINNER